MYIIYMYVLGRHELCVFFPWLLLLNLDCSHLEPWATIIKHANNFCDFNSHLNSAACVEVCVCVCVCASLIRFFFIAAVFINFVAISLRFLGFWHTKIVEIPMLSKPKTDL